jgi:ELWxxDGT repeat protein
MVAWQFEDVQRKEITVKSPHRPLASPEPDRRVQVPWLALSLLLIVAALLTTSASASASGASMVRDIYPAAAGSDPAGATNVGGTTFFVADDGIHGKELWRSDGTAAGTKLVLDIVPGRRSSYPYGFTEVAGMLYFAASPDGTHGQGQLWRSDGTAAGTKLVHDFGFAPGGTGLGPLGLTNAHGTLYFAASDDVHGWELWRSNGTAAGTKLVSDINPGPGGAFEDCCAALANVAGTLFFAADDGTHGDELWRSDGTAAGTKLVSDINAGSDGSYHYGSYPRHFTSASGTLFFAADDGTHGDELWRSDGTAAGTKLVSDVNPGPGGGFEGAALTNVAGTLFFAADDGTHGGELWRSDGTAAGTKLVKDIGPGMVWTCVGGWQCEEVEEVPASSGPSGLTSINGALFFAANDRIHGDELWRSDGTNAGTTMVKDVRPGTEQGSVCSPEGCGETQPIPASSNPWPLTEVDGTLLFAAIDGFHGRELWITPALQHALEVTKAGTGSGAVTSSPAGISCGPVCSDGYDDGTAVTLTATPVSGSTFAGWSGSLCSGIRTCTVMMDSDRTVTATFQGKPETMIAKAKIRGERHRVKFSFTGSGGVPPLDFKCKLTHESKELRRWRRCSSPKIYRHMKKSRHVFKVKTIDSRSVADPTPARERFQIP